MSDILYNLRATIKRLKFAWSMVGLPIGDVPIGDGKFVTARIGILQAWDIAAALNPYAAQKRQSMERTAAIVRKALDGEK